MARIKHIYIDRSVATDAPARKIIERIGAPATVIDNPEALFEIVMAAKDPIRTGKHLLYLTENRGGFIRSCPGTRNYTCCGYMILHIGTYCTMDCAYCILQSYFHPPVLQFFVNHAQLFNDLASFFKERSHRRIGTGEYTDSLIWEPWTGLSQKLIPYFGTQSHAVLELKTKTVHIDAIQGLAHNRRTIMAWSVNTPDIIRRNESGTAPLGARIDAAVRCQQWGYPLAFHFDPIVDYEGCVEDYRRVVDGIFDRISADNIVWISLGTLRYMPALKGIILSRWPQTKLPYGEFITGLDGKSRYLKHIRIDIYRGILDAIRNRSRDVAIYFCMESPEVWQQVFGYTPERFGGLPRMLDQSAIEKCRLDP